MPTNYDEFKQSLDALVNQAQHTAQLGLDVAKEQIEAIAKSPNLQEQMDEVRRNLQTMAHEMEVKAQEIVHAATTYVNPAAAPKGAQAQGRTAEPPRGNESATAAGTGTAQHGSDMSQGEPTQGGEVPKQ